MGGRGECPSATLSVTDLASTALPLGEHCPLVGARLSTPEIYVEVVEPGEAIKNIEDAPVD